MDSVVTDKIIEVLIKSENIAILPHIQADGDALGSGLALVLALEKKNNNKKVVLYLEENIPRMYNFLPGKEKAVVYPNYLEVPETAIAIDTGDIDRLGNRASLFKKAKTTINIDHHLTNTSFADLNYISSSSSAVGEIVYHMLKKMNLNISQDIATCLYVAIATDTGGFKFSNTTSITHLVTADLVSKGINITEISSRVFDSITIEKLRLIGFAINSLELFDCGRIAFITITEDMIRKSGAQEEECEGIINIARNLVGVEISALFREKENEIKITMRSNSEDMDVALIARKYGGGGHKRAAGCIINNKLENAKEMILNDIINLRV